MALRDTSPSGRMEQGAVGGLFRECSRAEQAITELKAKGFSDSQIGVAHSAGSSAPKPDRSFWDRIRGKSEEREEEVHYTQPTEFEESLQAGGMPADQSRYFGSKLEPGGCLVTVSTLSARAAEAIAILERNGADVGTRAAEFRPMPTAAPVGERRIQLLGEMLRVHKERVSRGEVRLHKQVVTETRNIEVPVTREEVVIERVPAGGEPARGEIGTEKDKEVTIPLSEEQVRVEKEPVVTGEVRVGKRQVQETKNVTGEVRHEEVKVEKEGDVNVTDKDIAKKDEAA